MQPFPLRTARSLNLLRVGDPEIGIALGRRSTAERQQAFLVQNIGLSRLTGHRTSEKLKCRLGARPSYSCYNNTLRGTKIKKNADPEARKVRYILTFIKHEDAPHHNNYGEYIIKKGVVKRKMSGGSMSPEGVRAYACIQSIAMTCQLRGVSFHRFLKASLVCYIRTGRPMLLAEYESSLKPVAIAA